MDRDAGLHVPRHDRPFHGGGAAPARKQRRMHVEPHPLRQQVLGDQEPVRDDHDRSSVEIEVWSESLGLEHWNPETLGRLLRRWWRCLPPSPSARVRAGQEERDLVALGEPLEDVGTEGRRGRDRDLGCHRAPRTGC